MSQLVLIRSPYSDGKYHVPAVGKRKRIPAEAAACRPSRPIVEWRVNFEDEVERSEICKHCLAIEEQS